MRKKICVFDLEGDGLLDTVSRIWCGVFIDVTTQEVAEFTPDNMDAMLPFMDGCDVLIAHNGVGYDFPALEKVYQYEYEGSKVDTLLMSRLQKSSRPLPPTAPKGIAPHSVEAWGWRLGRAKPSHEDWSQYSEEMLHRCREDAFIQLGIYRELMSEGKGMGWGRAHKLTAEVFSILSKQEQYGWLVDQDHIRGSIAQLDKWMEKIHERVVPFLPYIRVVQESKTDGTYNFVRKPFLKSGGLSKRTASWVDDVVASMPAPGVSPLSVGGPFTRVEFRRVNIDSNAEVKAFLLKEGWKPAAWNTNSDGKRSSPKLDKNEDFEGLEGKAGKSIAKRFVCKHRKAQLEGFLRVVRPDGRVPQVISGLASTGRLKHNVIVNVPGNESFYGKQMRRCFVTKPGYVLVGTDSAGCQNRMLAARVGDDDFTNILVHGDKEKGTSIHQINQQAIETYTGKAPSYRVSKNLNYAFMFGATNGKLGSMMGGGTHLGESIRQALLSISPGFQDLIESLKIEWRSTAKRRANRWGKVEYYGGYIKGLDGRPIFIDSEHKLLVFMLQSDEAILMQKALTTLYNWCRMEGWIHGKDYGFVANNHDEFQTEVREEIALAYSELASESITEAGKLLNIACPHEGESSIGYSWRDTH